MGEPFHDAAGCLAGHPDGGFRGMGADQECHPGAGAAADRPGDGELHEAERGCAEYLDEYTGCGVFYLVGY